MGSVVAVIVSLLLLLYALDHSYQPGVGGLDLVAMERSLRFVDDALAQIGVEVTLPCGPTGDPVSR